jgi:hypothetical protein
MSSPEIPDGGDLERLPAGVELVGSTVCVAAHAVMDMEAIRALRPFVRSKAAAVCVRVEISADSRPPDAKLRQAMIDELFDPTRIRAIALVHSGRSVRSRAIRATLALVAAVRKEPPVDVFESVDSAQSWLDSRLESR